MSLELKKIFIVLVPRQKKVRARITQHLKNLTPHLRPVKQDDIHATLFSFSYLSSIPKFKKKLVNLAKNIVSILQYYSRFYSSDLYERDYHLFNDIKGNPRHFTLTFKSNPKYPKIWQKIRKDIKANIIGTLLDIDNLHLYEMEEKEINGNAHLYFTRKSTGITELIIHFHNFFKPHITIGKIKEETHVSRLVKDTKKVNQRIRWKLSPQDTLEIWNQDISFDLKV